MIGGSFARRPAVLAAAWTGGGYFRMMSPRSSGTWAALARRRVRHRGHEKNNGFIRLGIAKFFARQPLHCLGIRPQGVEFGLETFGDLALLLQFGFQRVNVPPELLVLLDERNIFLHDEQQNSDRREGDDDLRELAPNAEIYIHPASLTPPVGEAKADFIVSPGKTVTFLLGMIKVFFLVFEPGATWDKIAQARRGYAFITIVHLLPLILMGTALEAWGLHHHGKWQPRLQFYKPFSLQEIITFETIQLLLLVGAVLVTALLIHRICQTFQERLTFLQAFTVAAYGFSPFFLMHFLDASAAVHPAVPWLLGVAGVIWILYQGIPRVMQTDPTHAFGVYVSTVFVVILATFLARVVTAMYLLGYMDLQHSWLSHRIESFMH